MTDYIRSCGGKRVYLFDDPAKDLALPDIAHSLGMQSRYGGHCRLFYSVAEHCVLLSDYAFEILDDPELAASLLFHDAPESVTQDMLGPIKRHMIDYQAFESSVVASFIKHFPLVREHASPEVRKLDHQIMTDEFMQNMVGGTDGEESWLNPEPLGVTLQFWTPCKAAQKWLSRAMDYSFIYRKGVPA